MFQIYLKKNVIIKALKQKKQNIFVKLALMITQSVFSMPNR